MENQRIILFFALSVVLLLIWQSWQNDYAPQTAVPTELAAVSSNAVDIPSLPVSTSMENIPDSSVPVADFGDTLKRGQRIAIETDTFSIELDSFGGDVRKAGLVRYPVSLTRPDKPFLLMEDKGLRIHIAQSGLLSKQSAPNHHAKYQLEKTEYRMAEGQDILVVPMVWQKNGIKVTKTFTFTRGSHLIDVSHKVENNTDQPWHGYQYRQLQRTTPGDEESSMFIYTYTGGVIYSDEQKYEKIDFDDMQDSDLNRDIDNGWAAMIQHYFLSAWLPEEGETNHYYTKAPTDKPYVLGLTSPEKVIEAGSSATFNSKLYIGPKDQDALVEIAEGLRLTVDYGMLTFLAQPVFWLLSKIHGILGNWGFAIIIVTFLIKLVFYKLSEKSYKSMANMRRLHPKVTKIRERFSDDRQRMSKAMMELYKKEKINPLGGCLPIIVQIPVFIALYWVLLESVEMRQAPFILWIQDLSAKDPYYILPVLMGITMFIQQKLNPPPPDPIQAKVLMALPFIFTGFFAFFPSGLVLYWVANSMLSISQQWYITRKIEKAAGTSS